MRRILFPLLVIGLAGGLFTLGSGAFFSDTEVDEGNVITAGTLDLVIGSSVGSCDRSPVYPGQTLTACSITLQQSGNLDNLHLYAELHADGIADSCSGEFCNAAANLGAGDLIVEACSYNSGACPWTFTAGTTTLAQLISQSCVALDTDFDGGASRVLSIQFSVSTAVGNTAQGDGIDVKFHFGLTQAADIAADRCHPTT